MVNKKQFNGKRVILKEGRFFRFLSQNLWEYFERSNCTGIVIIVAITDDQKVILTEQYRVPVSRNVIEFPAGLVNDLRSNTGESLRKAAQRELLEESGFRAEKFTKIIEGPTSAGSSSDIVTIFRAEKLRKIGKGGGDETEAIKVYEIPLSQIEQWLEKKREAGCLVDPKIYAGLYFLRKYNE